MLRQTRPRNVFALLELRGPRARRLSCRARQARTSTGAATCRRPGTAPARTRRRTPRTRERRRAQAVGERQAREERRGVHQAACAPCAPPVTAGASLRLGLGYVLEPHDAHAPHVRSGSTLFARSGRGAAGTGRSERGPLPAGLPARHASGSGPGSGALQGRVMSALSTPAAAAHLW